jgi:hypothetical protein
LPDGWAEFPFLINEASGVVDNIIAVVNNFYADKTKDLNLRIKQHENCKL